MYLTGVWILLGLSSGLKHHKLISFSNCQPPATYTHLHTLWWSHFDQLQGQRGRLFEADTSCRHASLGTTHKETNYISASVKLLSAVFDAWSLFPATTVPWSQASYGLAAQRINLLSHTCHADFRLLGEQWLPSGSFNRCMRFLQILVTQTGWVNTASKHGSNICLPR